MLHKEGRKSLVQCKQWRNASVGVPIIREQFGILTDQGADECIVVTSGSFTSEAVAFARGKPMRLIDGPQLLALVKAVQDRAKAELKGRGSEVRMPSSAPESPKSRSKSASPSRGFARTEPGSSKPVSSRSTPANTEHATDYEKALLVTLATPGSSGAGGGPAPGFGRSVALCGGGLAGTRSRDWQWLPAPGAVDHHAAAGDSNPRGSPSISHARSVLLHNLPDPRLRPASPVAAACQAASEPGLPARREGRAPRPCGRRNVANAKTVRAREPGDWQPTLTGRQAACLLRRKPRQNAPPQTGACGGPEGA